MNDKRLKTITRFLKRRRIGFALGLIFFLGLTSWGQPTQIVTKPTEDDVRRFLQAKINNESEGRIWLNQLKADQRVPSEGSVTMFFLAEAHFSEPCIWDIRSNGSPLSFSTITSPGTNQVIETKNEAALEVSRRGQGYIFGGEIIFERKDTGWSPLVIRMQSYPKRTERQDFARISCNNNLKQIAVALRDWAATHDNSFAFNLSTNVGGTKELCILGTGGFDKRPQIHLRAMAGRQLDPRILVCPADLKTPATSMTSLQETNVSYQLRVGQSVTLDRGKEILCQCPIHNIAISCEGRINYLKPQTN